MNLVRFTCKMFRLVAVKYRLRKDKPRLYQSLKIKLHRWVLFGAKEDSQSTLVFGPALYTRLPQQPINRATDLYGFLYQV